MPNSNRPWEHGSEFHWLDFSPAAALSRNPWNGDARFFGSGRDVLNCLLACGLRERGWRRIWIPSYLCQEVVASLLAVGLEGVLYPDSPLHGRTTRLNMTFEPGDVLLLVNHFGLRRPPDLERLDRRVVEIIEDHTHDPWSSWAFGSKADYAIASLRKTLPVPDGAVLWSPCQKALPRQCDVSDIRRQASQNKLSGMLMKALYLQGHDVLKEQYRRLFAAGETNIAAGIPSGMTEESRLLLHLFPIDRWRAIRRENHHRLSEQLALARGVNVLTVNDPKGCPFSAVLVFDSENRRDAVRRDLVAERIYTAILWPMKCDSPLRPSADDRWLSSRLLSLHCDMRYSDCDIDRVAEAVLRANSRYSATTDFGPSTTTMNCSPAGEYLGIQHDNCPVSR